MNTYATKPQRNKSQPVANAVFRREGNSTSTFQFADNRPVTVAQKRLQEIANNSLQIKQLRASQKKADVMAMKSYENGKSFPNSFLTTKTLNSSPVQRQVPSQGDGKTKEIPNTVYTARGGKDIPFDKDKHPRSMFSFGGHTRNAVFQKYNPQYAGSRIISIRSSTGEQVNVEGIQLDHQISWDTISNTMDTHNKELASWNNQEGYTLWDAKMYYNDIENLVPALGAINASAGELGVNEIPRIHPGLEIYQGNLQTAWMNLQAGLVAVGQGISDENAERIAGLLHGITTSMHDVTEQIL